MSLRIAECAASPDCKGVFDFMTAFSGKRPHQETVRSSLSIPLVLAIAAWAAILFVFTCTDSLTALMNHEVMQFHWTWQIHLRDLLVTNDAHLLSAYWLFIKAGHFSGFAVLDVLLTQLLRRSRSAAWLTILFAISTELLQLGFGRDGRLYDMGIDTLGVLFVQWLHKLHQKELLRRPKALQRLR